MKSNPNTVDPHAVRASDWIEQHSRRTPHKLAQIDLTSGRRFTYRKMNDRVGRIAEYLASIGVDRGDRVGLLLPNSTDALEIIFATWRLGGIAVPFDLRLSIKELTTLIKDAQPSVMFFDHALQKTMEALRESTGVPAWIATDGAAGDTPYEMVMRSVDPKLAKTLDQPSADPCLLLYSAGTTARPKASIVTHEMLTYSALDSIQAYRITQDSVHLAGLPFYRAAGLNAFAFPVLCLGGHAIIQRDFAPSETWAALADTELSVTHFVADPAIYRALLDHTDRPATTLAHLQVMAIGGATVSAALIERWSRLDVRLQPFYGATETLGVGCLLPADQVGDKDGAAGIGGLHLTTKIANEDGTSVPDGQRGELWMRGPAIAPGYWNRPEATAKHFIDGWFKTGDLAHQDDDGCIYIEDRMADTYTCGGEKVCPVEVERALASIEAIDEVAVIGVDDSEWGQVGCAVVALKTGQRLSLDDVVRHVTGLIDRFKHPAHLVVVDALPRNPAGHVRKYRLRKSIPPALTLR
ncbi:MAG: AMP-binding protein [Myxococcota bacterium]